MKLVCLQVPYIEGDCYVQHILCLKVSIILLQSSWCYFEGSFDDYCVVTSDFM